jgi:hypothetical protein
MSNVKFINNLKLRGSRGYSGSNSGGLFASLPLISPGANYITSAGLAPSQLGNPNLGWETSIQSDLALEVGLFNRINLTAELYHRKTNDWMVLLSITRSSDGMQILHSLSKRTMLIPFMVEVRSALAL